MNLAAMLPLVTISAAFLLGLLCSAPGNMAILSWTGTAMVFWMGLAGSIVSAILALWRPRPIFLCTALFGLGLLVGSARRPEEAGSRMAPGHHIVTGKVRESRQVGRNRWVIDLDDAQVNNRRATPPRPMELWTQKPPPPGLAPGLWVVANCRRGPGSRRGPVRMQCRTMGVWAGHQGWSLAGIRTWIRKRTDRLLSRAATSHSELLWAIVLGSRLRHKRGIKSSFARLGIAHVLVVSGLHLGMLALLALLFWRLLFTLVPPLAERYPARKAGAWLALPTLWLYVLVAGGSPATIRAGIMATSLLVGLVTDRPAAAARTLILAGLALLSWRPEWLFDPGFQLSFAATGALVWLGHAWKRDNDEPVVPGRSSMGPAWASRFAGKTLAGAVLASLAAWIATAPLAAHWFGGFSLAGPLANLVAVPFFCWLVLPLGLAGLSLGLLWPTAGRPFLWLADALADRAAGMVVQLARQVQWTWVQVRPLWWQTAVAMVLVALAGGLVLQWHDEIRPWKPRRFAALLLILAGAGLILGATPGLQGPDRGEMQVLFLGSRAGNTIVVLTSDATLVIDGGGGQSGGRALVAELKRRGRNRVDLLIATHPHWDHTSGLSYLVRHVRVRRLWMTGRSAAGTWQALLSAAADRGVAVRTPKNRNIAGLAIEVLPLPGRRRREMDPALSRNDNSLALRFRYQGRSFVAVGDLEQVGQDILVASGWDLAADLLAAPHHGSAQSFLPEFLAAVDPFVVVISGHTAATEPALYERLGATVLLTEQRGPLEVTLSPNRELPRIRALDP